MICLIYAETGRSNAYHFSIRKLLHPDLRLLRRFVADFVQFSGRPDDRRCLFSIDYLDSGEDNGNGGGVGGVPGSGGAPVGYPRLVGDFAIPLIVLRERGITCKLGAFF
jgi:hypothetical protein